MQGCDASVLLNDTATFTGEQGALPNRNSLRGFAVIDNIKAQVEAVCNQTVSCADILAVAARDSVVALGGPSWTVLLGRRDSTTASKANAESDLPAPSFDLANLTQAFANKGLNVTDMVALSGGHTIGQAQCRFFRDHIYNDTNINSTFASSLQGSCPPGERQRRRHPGAAGRDVAHRVRQRLLLQPAKSEGAPALGPGALERRQHRRDGPELRVQRVGVQQRLCGGDGEDGEHQPQDGEPGPGQERLLQGQLLISIDC